MSKEVSWEEVSAFIDTGVSEMLKMIREELGYHVGAFMVFSQFNTGQPQPIAMTTNLQFEDLADDADVV